MSDADEHGRGLDHVLALCNQLDIHSLLDVGCGTGRAIRHLAKHPTLELFGVEPVAALLNIARTHAQSPPPFTQASGTLLPFRSNSIDAVCATGVMHHVADATPIVTEMIRVARVAIFISDYNRFGAGPSPWRWVKLLLAKTGMWPLVYRLRTGGRGYNVTEGDGVAYSYSIYDSFKLLRTWTNQVYVYPTTPLSSNTWYSPLLSATHGLLCAIQPSATVPRGRTE